VTDGPRDGEEASFWQRLRRRKVVQWGIAYAAGAWGLLQGISYVTATFHLPEKFQQGASVLLLLGLPIALTIAWYHGDRGEQRVTRTELAILTLLFLLGGGLFWRYQHATEPDSAAGAEAASATVQPATVPRDTGPSIAVLPFENRSASGEDAAFFADGIQEDLINTLSRVPGLTVMARTAVLPFRDTKMNLAQVAADLGVSHLVEAGVQRAGDRVRINVQLVRASDGQTEWSERYDRTLTADNIFDLQEEITEAVATTLQLQLDKRPGEHLLTGTTGNLAAYERFLKRRKEWSDGSTPESVRLFKEALKLDPDYALAHGALAEAYVVLALEGTMPAPEAFALAKASAQRALELDDHVVQAYTALGEYEFHYAWNWPEADKAMLHAIAIDPNYAVAYSRQSGHLAGWGRYDEAMEFAKRSAELSADRGRIVGLGLLISQRRYREVLDLTAGYASPQATDYLKDRAIALLKTGHPEEALRRLERWSGLRPDLLSRLEVPGWAYGQAGQVEKARAIIGRFQALSKSGFVSPILVAKVAAALDDRDLAFEKLQEAYELHDGQLPFIGDDFEYDPVRDDPRFRELLRKMKLDVFFPEATRT
jgi:TolB-like protein/Tfp pilus assembly protein PilF